VWQNQTCDFRSAPARSKGTALLLLTFSGSLLAAADYESLPALEASAILPAEWPASTLHRVDSEVRIEEGLDVFVVRSTHGVEEIHGYDLLRKRIREIHATSALSEKGVGKGGGGPPTQ
jgi:hypothetical protein